MTLSNKSQKIRMAAKYADQKGQILVIATQMNRVRQLTVPFKKQYTLSYCPFNLSKAKNHLKDTSQQIVLCYEKNLSTSQIRFIQTLKKNYAHVAIILITENITLSQSIALMRSACGDILREPVTARELKTSIEQAFQKQSRQILSGMYEASQAIFKSLDLNDVFKRVLHITNRIFNADETSVLAFNKSGQLELAATNIPKKITPVRPRSTKQPRSTVAEKVVQLQKPLLLHGNIKHQKKFKTAGGEARVKSSIVYPITSGGHPHGVLCLNRTKQNAPFTEKDVKHVAVFASQLATAMENAVLYKQVEKRVAELDAAYHQLSDSQQRLVQFEKMASVGRFVAGVAHELSNPLTSVIGYVSLIRDESLPENVITPVDRIYDNAIRCKKIVQNLLSFSRPKSNQKLPTLLNTLVEEAETLMQYHLKKFQVELVKKLDASLPEVLLDEHQIKQVIVNLMDNAIYATQANAALTTKKRQVKVSTGQNNHVVWLEIHDHGIGMDKKEREKIFEPFFTTKPVGQGTGLGLSLCYSIITKEHQGTIDVQSKPRRGTTFRVTFPKLRHASSKRTSATTKTIEKLSVPASILVIDDEASILEVYRKSLEPDGHTIYTADSGEAALDLLKQHEVDYIISDIRMPGMTGRDVYEAIENKWPNLKQRVLFASGDFLTPETRDWLNRHQLPILAKPFTIKELCEALARLEA